MAQAGVSLAGEWSRLRLAELASEQVCQRCEDLAQSQWSGVGHLVRETHGTKAGKTAALRHQPGKISTDPRRQEEMWQVIKRGIKERKIRTKPPDSWLWPREV